MSQLCMGLSMLCTASVNAMYGICQINVAKKNASVTVSYIRVYLHTYVYSQTLYIDK